VPPLDELSKFIVSLLVIANPIGAIPVFLALTEDQTPEQKRHTAKIAPLAVAITLIAAILAGNSLLRFFGIDLSAFRVGGGILILLMAVAMLHAKRSGIHQTSEEADEAEEKDTVAIVPLAIPMLAGPGAISTVILATGKSSGPLYTVSLFAGPIILSLALWLSFRFAAPVGRLLGKTGINIATRLMGLVLAAIAVEFITQGLMEIFPVLAQRG
jgi:multiple antibiotic resistance protein